MIQWNPRFIQSLIVERKTMSSGFAVVLVFVAATSLNPVSTLDCLFCELSANWETCRKESTILECTIKRVNQYHGDMRESNPTLEKLDESTPNVTFSCFSMEMEFTGGGVAQSGVISGCTFKQQQICEGWTDETALTKCNMCESKEICSAGSRSFVGENVEMMTKIVFTSAVMVIANVYK